MKNRYEVLVWLVLWLGLTIFFDIVGVGDWNLVDYMIIFIIVYIPIYIMIRWVMVTNFDVND